jgi:capsule polysaccharide export protein KpsE/RkpR
MRDHRDVASADEAVEALAAKYRDVLVEMDSCRIESGEKPRSWNRLVNKMQALQLQLRATQADRDAITSLVGDENPTVRSWSAVNALAWAESVARADLEREASADSGLRGFEAQVALREFDTGRLDTAWLPKKT